MLQLKVSILPSAIQSSVEKLTNWPSDKCHLLVMTFKCRKRVNTAMPANTLLPANSDMPANTLLPANAAMPANTLLPANAAMPVNTAMPIPDQFVRHKRT